jgi:hypothetical protein
MTMNSTFPAIVRSLDLASLLGKKSHFLLGPRQTGKTTLIRQTLPGALLFDLLDSAVYLALSQNPHRIEEELTCTNEVPASTDAARARRPFRPRSCPRLRNASLDLLFGRPVGGSGRLRRNLPAAGGRCGGSDAQRASLQPVPACGRALQRHDREFHERG